MLCDAYSLVLYFQTETVGCWYYVFAYEMERHMNIWLRITLTALHMHCVNPFEFIC